MKETNSLEDRRNFTQALRTHNRLKKDRDRECKTKYVDHQESQFRDNTNVQFLL